MSTFIYDSGADTTYGELIESARLLVSEPGLNPEYERGIVNLIADVFGVEDMDTSTRMDQIAVELGWPTFGNEL